jgi:formylglycine-generating enzyme required for sulfatase activity
MVCLLSAATVAAAEKRIALVIGNSAYKGSPLKNPSNDARAITAKLKKLGFDVVSRENLRTADIGNTLRDFRSRLQPGSVALFFYAGHGLQLKGINYLPTIDANIQNEDDVPFNSININQLLDIMDDAKTRLNLVFLDACRNNPFTRRFRSADGGLARISAPSGTLISFATRPGSVASDGDGENGLYTQHLLTQMDLPNQPIEQNLKRVVIGVKKDSQGAQEPWMEGSLDGDFYFLGGPVAAQPAAESPVAAATAPVVVASNIGESATFELSFWDAIKGSDNADDYRAYLQKYPQGQFAPLAEARLRRLAPPPATEAVVSNANSGVAAVAGVNAVHPAASRAEAAKAGPVTGPLRDCPECPELVVVPAGKFQMGGSSREAGSGESERPRHEVQIPKPLAVGRYEVTRAQFEAFVKASGHSAETSCHVWVGNEWVNQPGRNWRKPDFSQDDNHPAVCVNWNDAKAYVAWLSMRTGKPYRLLTESEWEYAARAGTRTSRYWGDDPELACEFANVHDASTQQSRNFSWENHQCHDDHVDTAPVGKFKPNAFGLHDMLGNAWEWVEDCLSVNYIGAPSDGSARVSDDCQKRVYRGGGWSGPAFPRSAGRNGNAPNYRSQLLGIRVVRPAP